ncbi:hypothetical protein [Novosphingobium album (ex Liu et al. 2023)]|nr:hypothetical protein [Novosphingobium album (ex Liu et al. 2023)]
MKRMVGAAALAVALFAAPEAVRASGDFGCYPQWRLANPDYACSNRAVLSPGNDTRVNLLYLLRDRAGLATGPGRYPAAGYDAAGFGHVFLDWDQLKSAYYRQPDEAEDAGSGGSRCDSRGGGGDAFGAALAANRAVPESERARLTAARALTGQACAGGDSAAPAWPEGIASTAGRDFLTYLKAADAFYAGRFDEARASFGALRKAQDPWLAETSAYMVARNELVAAQAPAFDEWGDYAGAGKVDKAAVKRGQDALAAYLKAWPSGRYADSARGLVRRAYWLAGDAAGLSRAYAAMLDALDPAGAAAPDLVQEIDNKLLFARGLEGGFDAPLLLATWDLMRMRIEEVPEGEQSYGDPPLSAQELAAQQPMFAGRPDLYGFVQASHAYYVARDYRRVIALIPDDARQPGYAPLAFSRQVLRGMALEAVNDRNAAGFWQDLLGGAKDLYQRPIVEMALALNWERHGKLADVFARGSPIGEAPVREILLQQSAGPELLRAVAARADLPVHERDVATYALLYKQLSRGRYAEFNRDLALVRKNAGKDGGTYDWSLQDLETVPVGLFTRGGWSDGYACPALARTTATLAAEPGNVKANLCLGEFYRLNGFDDLASNGDRPAADELGGAVNGFPQPQRMRAAIYDAVIADPAATPDDKAYALYRAVWCYGPSGNNSCGGADAPEARRKAWFQQLKRDYPGSRWARELKYYW